jgi:hypothetical protein
MGNAMLSLGHFDEALEYFYRHSLSGYGRAFRDFRTHYIRENFNMLLAFALVGIILIAGGNIAYKVIKKRRAR